MKHRHPKVDGSEERTPADAALEQAEQKAVAAQVREDSMLPTLRRLEKHLDENHIYATLMATLGVTR